MTGAGLQVVRPRVFLRFPSSVFLISIRIFQRVHKILCMPAHQGRHRGRGFFAVRSMRHTSDKARNSLVNHPLCF